MAGIVAKLEPRVIEVEKVVPLEAKAPIVQVSKASDDIYARYDYAASNTEIDGTYIGYESNQGMVHPAHRQWRTRADQHVYYWEERL